MNLHYAVVSHTNISSPCWAVIFKSCFFMPVTLSVRILMYVSCYDTADAIIVVWDLRIAWRKSTVTLSPSRWRLVWTSWVGPHCSYIPFLPDMHDCCHNCCDIEQWFYVGTKAWSTTHTSLGELQVKVYIWPYPC